MYRLASIARPALLLVTLVVIVPGCSWWNGSDDKDAATTVADQPGFSAAPLRVLPVDAMSKANFALPNSFVQTVQELVDTEVDRSLRVRTPSQLLVRRRLDEPLLHSLAIQRNVLLPRQQIKRVGGLCFIPPVHYDSSQDMAGDIRLESNEVRISHQLLDGGFGGLLDDGSSTVRLLRRLQRLVVVVSATPENLVWWRSLNSFNEVVDPVEGVAGATHPVVLLDARNLATDLPSNPLAWDAIGLIIWNDGDPSLMPTATRDALIDWVAAGGILLINTPAAAPGLIVSPLAELTPLNIGTAAEQALKTGDQLGRFDVPRAVYRRALPSVEDYAEDLDDLLGPPTANDQEPAPFTVTEAAVVDPSSDQVAPGELPVKSSSLVGTGDWVPTQEGLLAERTLGRGRVLATTFDLNHQDIRNWDAAGNWFHTVVMRLPPRRWDMLQGHYTEGPGHDLPLGALRLSAITYRPNEPLALAGHDNDIATALARPYVQTETKIKTPSRSAVLRMMLSYVGVIVIGNYVLFRIVDRVQWAWIALPVLALGGVVYFIRALQLEIGFNRSQQGIGILQVYGDHPRGHLSQFTSVYSSLSESVDAVLPPDRGFVRLSSIAVVPDAPLEYRYANREGEGLIAFPLRSQTAALIHSEEIVDLGGAIEFQQAETDESDRKFGEFTNRSDIDLRDAWVIYNSKQIDLVAPLGDFRSGDTVSLTEDKWIDRLKWRADRLSSEAPSTAMSACFELAIAEETGIVLIGWSDRGVSQLAISPTRAVQENRTVIYGRWQAAQPTVPPPDLNRPPKFLLSDVGS